MKTITLTDEQLRTLIDATEIEVAFRKSHGATGDKNLEDALANLRVAFEEKGLCKDNSMFRTSEEWEDCLSIIVIDEDGWRKDSKDWNTPISKEEFLQRCASSTCEYPAEFFEYYRTKN